ncbi:MAG: DNA replication/repair protein RecF [Clostridiales bacterium]|nr:DNA replication/repair protein RecF [Clostridiales bacterium]MDD7386772.1 DNA replication/repair protein RecF [Bacillota bacterium]MDY6040488.1 DNA replication/repair protein RecF [Candidatus Faecousia sp.]
MRLLDLKLRDFRNYESLELEFDPGVNLIVGSNAQGKTNLLEAVCYAGSGRSFRTQKQGELIRFHADFAEIEAQVHAEERQQSLRWVLFSGARPRQIYRNGAKKKSASEIAGVLPTVLFCPEDLMVLKSGAAARRRLGDQALCQLRPNYDAALTEYNRILDQKSRILKDHFEYPGVLEVLPEYNARLCQVGALLISYRARFYDSLGRAAARYHSQFSGGAEEFRLEYRTVSTVKDPFAPVARLTQDLYDHLDSHYRAELESGQCLTGPHKDDFDVSLSGINLKAYGSQGQTRTAAISLKLAQRELMGREWGEEPVLLLDDVLSELDQSRQDFVLNQIVSGQVFITCCEPGRFTRLGKTIEIQNGKVNNL